MKLGRVSCRRWQAQSQEEIAIHALKLTRRTADDPYSRLSSPKSAHPFHPPFYLWLNRRYGTIMFRSSETSSSATEGPPASRTLASHYSATVSRLSLVQPFAWSWWKQSRLRVHAASDPSYEPLEVNPGKRKRRKRLQLIQWIESRERVTRASEPYSERPRSPRKAYSDCDKLRNLELKKGAEEEEAEEEETSGSLPQRGGEAQIAGQGEMGEIESPATLAGKYLLTNPNDDPRQWPPWPGPAHSGLEHSRSLSLSPSAFRRRLERGKPRKIQDLQAEKPKKKDFREGWLIQDEIRRAPEKNLVNVAGGLCPPDHSW